MGPMLAPWTLLPGYLFMKMMSFLGAILYHCYIIYAYNALGNICEHKINKNPQLNFCEIFNQKRYITLPLIHIEA